MFISKKDLGDLKSQVAEIKKELDLEEFDFFSMSHAEHVYRILRGLPTRRMLTLKTALSSIKSRLDQQEKMQKILFDHLGIEYAKITEETKAGKQEKEVLRKIKKQKSEKTA